MILKQKFETLCLKFNDDQNLINNLWTEIEQKYSAKNRHYHNLNHLENLFAELEAAQNQIENFSNISFSVFYHDVIYDATSKSNEDKSAELSKKNLERLQVHKNDIQKVFEQILATKFHQKSADKDTNFLLDADLSILGKNETLYSEYTKQIRKEYKMYPDLLYKPGRKKVLKQFLQLETIFKTDFFREQYEIQARKNLEAELQSM